VAALIVALTAVPLAQAADPSPAELKALEIRGQALNDMCGDSTLVGAAYRSLCGTVGGSSNRPTEAELRALEIRGQAMNAAGQVAQATRSSGFDWNDFGIGAGAMLGFVLLTGGIAAGVHYGRRGNVHPRPVS
jgi:hypothetical protein